MITKEGELTDLHKDIVLFLSITKEADYIELEKSLHRDRRHISTKCGDLVDRGVLSYREDEIGRKHYTLNKNKTKISYSSDNYQGILLYLGICFILSLFIGIIMNDYSFIGGSVLMGILIFSKYFYDIITEKDGKIVRIL